MDEIVLLWMGLCSVLCTVLAFQKERNVMAWGMSGALLTLPALVTLLYLPRLVQGDQRLASTINLRISGFR